MARSAALLPPTTDRHRSAVLPPSTGSVPGSRRSAVAGRPNFCLASGLLRPPVRLRGPRCFSTYTLSGVCLDVNRVRRAIFGRTASASAGRCCLGLRERVPDRHWSQSLAMSPRARAVQAAASERTRGGVCREARCRDPSKRPNYATPAFSSDWAWVDSSMASCCTSCCNGITW
jgi:hypothetical protein